MTKPNILVTSAAGRTGFADGLQRTVTSLKRRETMNADLITAQQWFNSGERIPYDHRGKKILRPGDAKDPSEVLHVFQRLVSSGASNDEVVWTTFLPGFPDGSFGWARVDRYLTGEGLVPKMFVEYIGQGNSDKPADYPYGTMERADLVEALWHAHGIKSTFVVTFDYSSLCPA